MADFTNDERRLYTRTPINLRVLIYYNDKLIGKKRTINISVGGALIESEDLGLPINSLAEIEFEVDENHPLKEIRLPVVVKRVTSNNIAISFEVLDKATEQLILENMVNSR